MNLGQSAIDGDYRGRPVILAAGGAFLDGGERQDFRGASRNRWVNVQVSKTLLSKSLANIDGRQSLAIAPDQPALALLRDYLTTLDQSSFGAGTLLELHWEETVIGLIGLTVGAAGEEAEQAGLGGVRTARLDSVPREIRDNYRNPMLSAKLVRLQLGLSPRYVQDLLAATAAALHSVY